MVQLQILSKIIATQDNSIIEDNELTEEYFVGYEEEFNYIQKHKKEYGNVPDGATFLSKFPSMTLVEVSESDKYLIDTIREEYLYYKSVPLIQKAADLQPNYQLGGIDIIGNASSRYEQFIERKDHQEDWFFTCGFEELDELIHGIQREEELFVIFARTNQGKSWILEKMCTHVWEIGFNVGYISPEMSAISVGYRFDTLHKNFSNKGLMWGRSDVEENNYKDYIDDLATKDNKFVVATPLDFDKKITVTKLKNWITKYKLDMVAIDGITYMTDERFRRGDNKTTSLTNISEDLMELSMELKVPILIVVQANRGGVVDKESNDTPDLESIRDSDGIAHNASKVLSIRQLKDSILKMEVKKQRFGSVGGKLTYNWDINTGKFIFIPSYDDAEPQERTERKVREIRKTYNDKEDVF